MPDVVKFGSFLVQFLHSPQSKHPEIFQDKEGVNKCLPAKDNRILTVYKQKEYKILSNFMHHLRLSWFLVIPFLELSKILQCELKFFLLLFVCFFFCHFPGVLLSSLCQHLHLLCLSGLCMCSVTSVMSNSL